MRADCPRSKITSKFMLRVCILILVGPLVQGCLVVKQFPYWSVVSEDAKYYLEGQMHQHRMIAKDLATGQVLKEWDGSYVSTTNSAGIMDYAVAVFAAGNSVDVWDLKNGSMIRRYKAEGTVLFGGPTLDRKYIVGIYWKSGQSYAVVWDAKTQQQIWLRRFDDDNFGVPTRVDITRDNSLIAVAGFGGVKVFPGPSIERGQALSAAFQYYRSTKADAIAFSRDGRRMAVTLDDKTVRVYDLDNSRLLWVSTQQKNRMWGVSFSYDGEYVMARQTDPFSKSLSKPWDIVVWRTATGDSILQKRINDVLNVSTDGRIYYKRQGSDVLGVLYWGGSWIEDMTNVSPDKDLDKLVENIIQITGRNSQRIALLEFPRDSNPFRKFEIFLREEITNRMIKHGHVSVVDPDLQEKAIQKLHPDGENPLGATESVKFGELTGATTLVFGTLTDQEKAVTFDLDVVGIDNPGINGHISTQFLKGPVVQNLLNQ
jgi:hypothetical protein